MRFDFFGGDRRELPESQRSQPGNERPATIRRKQMRYPLRASISFWWRDADGSNRQGKGWTRNVSEEGALISTLNCPAQGDQVDLLLQLPMGRSPVAPSTIRMDMKAEVVRLLLDSSGKKIRGFAVRKCDRVVLNDLKSLEFALGYGGLASLREN